MLFAQQDTENLAREAAMQELRKIVELCPNWSRYLAAAVLWGCKDCEVLVRNAAVGQLGPFLALCHQASSI